MLFNKVSKPLLAASALLLTTACVSDGTQTTAVPWNPHGKYKKVQHAPNYHYFPKDMEEVVIALDSGVLFDTGSAMLKPEATNTLNMAAKQIRRYASGPVWVIGHTDSVGSNMLNDKLSMRRAEAVGNWLSTHGDVSETIYAEGKGEKLPIATNATKTGRALNRRVEIRMTTMK